MPIDHSIWSFAYAQGRLPADFMFVGSEHLERIIPGHDGEIFTRHRSWTAGLNPVAEVHLAHGEKSRVSEGKT